MHNIKKTIILFTSLILYFSLCLSVKAESIIPYASDVFISYSASLSSSKIATFSCDLKKEYASVKVSKCVIQKCTKVAVKEEVAEWKDVKTLSNVCSQLTPITFPVQKISQAILEAELIEFLSPMLLGENLEPLLQISVHLTDFIL